MPFSLQESNSRVYSVIHTEVSNRLICVLFKSLVYRFDHGFTFFLGNGYVKIVKIVARNILSRQRLIPRQRQKVSSCPQGCVERISTCLFQSEFRCVKHCSSARNYSIGIDNLFRFFIRLFNIRVHLRLAFVPNAFQPFATVFIRPRLMDIYLWK